MYVLIDTTPLPPFWGDEKVFSRELFLTPNAGALARVLPLQKLHFLQIHEHPLKKKHAFGLMLGYLLACSRKVHTKKWGEHARVIRYLSHT